MKCREAGFSVAESTAQAMMLLYEDAIVTVGMETFAQPFDMARRLARRMLNQALA